MKIKIREATIEDAEGIVGVLNPIIEYSGLTIIDGPLTVMHERKYIQNFPERGILHVAINDDRKLVGFQGLEPFADYSHAFDHVATIGTYVSISQQRHGIGTELFNKTLEKAKEKGFEKIFTYVLAENEQALKFYLGKLGFNIVGRSIHQARLQGKYLDEIIIEKVLTSN